MNYIDAVNYYNNSPKFLSVPGNDELLKLLDYLGNPQKKLKYIHIAGTNGKGSVSVMLSEALIASGLKTGLFTSPYIEIFNERIRINGENIPNPDLTAYTEKIKAAIDELKIELTAFAKITATAFLYFFDKKCDIVVLETGLGGRLDATNVVTPLFSVITKIGFDHMEYLGDTLTKIASEKCGIIKPNIPVVTTVNQEDEVITVIKDFTDKNCSELILANDTASYELGLSGDYQKENAGIAVSVLKTMEISEDAIKSGLKNSHWPARFEFLSDNLLLDGAHNPNGIEAFLKSLKSLGKTPHFVIAMMKDKNYKESARLIREFGGGTTVTQIDNPRCLEAAELAKEFENAEIIPNPITAIETALLENDFVCVLGSLYLAGAVRRHFSK